MSASELGHQPGPPKVPYFYLSYARAEDESSVHDFFTDLSQSILFKAKLTSTEVPGRWNTSRQERDEALRTSRVMIALLSPAYFRDGAALFEWQIFELRRRCALLASHLSNRETLRRSIIPICWSHYSGSRPVEISQAPLFEGDLKKSPHEAGGVQSLPKEKCAAFVNSLALHIIEVTSSFQLTPLESIPDANLFPPFTFTDQPEAELPDMNSQPIKPLGTSNIKNLYRPVNQNLLIIDGAFMKDLAERVKNTAAAPAPVSNVNFTPPTTPAPTAASEKYSVVTIDDKPEDMQKIETTAQFSPDFHVKPYTNCDQLLEDIRNLQKDRKEPDLIVVNPALTVPRAYGYTLVEALLDENVPSAILATSKNRDAVRSLKVRGINDLVATLPESFTSVELLELMRIWAKAGRDKRYQRGRADKRRVFLSFSSQNEAMATKICKWLELREIGVWYSPHALEAGDPWREKIIQGLHIAEVFIALISDRYPGSRYCDAEMAVALARWPKERSDLRIIPVLYNAPTTALDDPQIKMSLDHQAVTISDSNWLPGVTQILNSVQSFLTRRQNQS